MSGLRSERWFGGRDLAGFIHRTSLHAEGVSRAALAGRPVVGICNSWSELVTCNLHFRGLADAVRRGVLDAGGLPLEFPTISLGENLMKPTSMLFRNLMSMDVEECIRAYPLDAVVLLGGCDKTVPAQLMGALSADVPAIVLTGGPSEPAVFRGRELSAGTDLWHYVEELRAGRMTQAEFDELEAAAATPYGHCNELGTASTLAALVEGLGMCLPGTAAIPAGDPARARAAEATGARAVELAREGLRPSRIVTAEALDNAITLLMALGGGTNAVVHLLALAGRAGVALTLDRFDELSRQTPVLANVRPSGEHLFEDLHRAGGVGAVLRELEPLLHAEALTVTGRTLGEEIADAEVTDRDVIAPLDSPRSHGGRIGRAPRLARSVGRGDQAERRVAVALRPPRPGGRVRGRLRPRRSDRRGRRDARLGARAPAKRPEGRPRHARVGPAAGSPAAPRAGRDRHGADLGRAHERNGVRDGRPARRAGVGGRRPARGRSRRRPDRARRRRAPPGPRPPGRARSSADSPSSSRPRPTTREATAPSTSSTSSRPTRAATSISSAPAPASRQRASRSASSAAGSAAGNGQARRAT